MSGGTATRKKGTLSPWAEIRGALPRGLKSGAMGTKVISLFSGAGGLDFGFEAAGFQTVLALEHDSMCCKTLRHNRSWPVLEADLLATPTAKILSAAGMRPGEPDAVIGGPPCQPFSKAGYWVNGDSERLDDPRAKTLGAF